MTPKELKKQIELLDDELIAMVGFKGVNGFTFTTSAYEENYLKIELIKARARIKELEATK